MIPPRRPRLMRERHAEESRTAEVAAQEHARALAAKATAEQVERDRARRRRANTPLARTLEVAGGWILSIFGALLVSLLLTYLVNHPRALDAIASELRSFLHVS